MGSSADQPLVDFGQRNSGGVAGRRSRAPPAGGAAAGRGRRGTEPRSPGSGARTPSPCPGEGGAEGRPRGPRLCPTRRPVSPQGRNRPGPSRRAPPEAGEIRTQPRAGESVNTVPHYQESCSQVSHIWGNCRGQQSGLQWIKASPWENHLHGHGTSPASVCPSAPGPDSCLLGLRGTHREGTHRAWARTAPATPGHCEDEVHLNRSQD